MTSPYVYVFIRKDLSLAQQLVQSNHSSVEAGFRFKQPIETARLVMLEVPDVAGLQEAAAHLDSLGIEHHLFFEPDFDIGHSAITTRPVYGEERLPLRKYPLYKPEAVTP